MGERQPCITQWPYLMTADAILLKLLAGPELTDVANQALDPAMAGCFLLSGAGSSSELVMLRPRGLSLIGRLSITS